MALTFIIVVGVRVVVAPGLDREALTNELHQRVLDFAWVPSSRKYVSPQGVNNYSHTVYSGRIFNIVRLLNPELFGDGVALNRYDYRWTHFERHRDSKNTAPSMGYMFGEFRGGTVYLEREDPKDEPEIF